MRAMSAERCGFGAIMLGVCIKFLSLALGVASYGCLLTILCVVTGALLGPASACPCRPVTLSDLQSQQAGASSSGPSARVSQTTADVPPTELEAIKHLVQIGQLKEAQASVQNYLTQHSDSADAHFLLGYILFREIQMGASAEGSTQGAQYNELSPALARLGKTNAEASLAEYTKGARYRKPSAADLKVVALDYVVLGDFSDADKWLTRTLQWNPLDADGWYHLGRVKYTLNLFADGVHAFEQCLKLDPKNVKAEDNLGLCYEGLGRMDEAIAAYRQALAWQTQAASAEPFVGPTLDLGSLLLDQNNPQDAVPYLRRAAEIAPQDSRIHEKLGKAYSQLNLLPEAQEELERAVELSPQNPRLHFMLGQIYRREGLLQKAKAELDRSAALSGTQSVR